MAPRKARVPRNALLAALAALAAGAAAAVPGEPPVYRSWQVWTTEAGLPDDRILALHVAGGRLWIGTQNGLARIEGSTIESWGVEDGLPHPVISAIDVDPRTDEVWLGTLGGGAIRFSAGRFDRFHQRNSGLAGDVVFDLRKAGRWVWLATNGGLSGYDAYLDAWRLEAERRLDEPETVVRNVVLLEGRPCYAAWLEGLRCASAELDEASAAVPDAPEIDGAVLLAAGHGLTRAVLLPQALHLGTERGPWTVSPIPGPPVEPGHARCLAIADDGGVWIGTAHGIRALADPAHDVWVEYAPHAGEAAWTATVVRAGRRGETATLDGGPPDPRVRAVAFDAQGVWVGTPRGLARGTLVRPPVPPRVPRAPPARDRSAPAEPASLDLSFFESVNRTIRLPWGKAEPLPPTVKGDLHTARLAIEDANRASDSPVPLRLVNRPPAFAAYGWGLPEDPFVEHVHEERALASAGLLPPWRRTSLAVVLLAEVPVVNLSTAPASAAERAVPWVFRCPINDPARHARVLDHAIDIHGVRRLGAVRTPDPLASLHLDWWLAHAARRGLELQADETWDPRADGATARIAQRLAELQVDAVLVWTSARRTAELLQALEAYASRPIFLGADWIAGDERLGNAGHPILAPEPCAHRRDVAALERWLSASNRPLPDTRLLTYDAVRHMADAVLAGGSDRETVRAALERAGTGAVTVGHRGAWRRVEVE